MNAAVAQGYLEALGCTSVWVKNGEEAVARSAVERFDLVLMDLNMPGMDGFATTTFIRQRERQQGAAHRLPIVALTAHDAVNYRERVLKADMDDILSKPYALEDCTRLLRRWLVNPGPSERIATPSVVSAKTGDAVVAVERSATNAVTTADAALDVIDNNAVEGLRRLRAGKQGDLYPRLVELFRPTCAASLSQLRDALAKSDLRVAAGICHKLASSAANVGALAYARTVRQLEQTCIAGDLPRGAGAERHIAIRSRAADGGTRSILSTGHRMNADLVTPTAIIADDEDLGRVLLAEAVVEVGLRSLTFDNGTDALQGALDNDVAMVLLDVDMPGLDGYAVCQRLRAQARFANVPIVMVTGHEDSEAIRRAFEAGATDFISKPVNWALLPRRLEYILRNAANAEHIERLAYYDPLTGLPNRQRCLETAERLFATRQSPERIGCGHLSGPQQFQARQRYVRPFGRRHGPPDRG